MILKLTVDESLSKLIARGYKMSCMLIDSYTVLQLVANRVRSFWLDYSMPRVWIQEPLSLCPCYKFFKIDQYVRVCDMRFNDYAANNFQTS